MIKEHHIENLRSSISRKVKTICLTDTLCEVPITKKWIQYQVDLLNKIFNQLDIVMREEKEVRFYEYYESDKLDYYLI